jgi:hypothetical protein
MLFGIEGRYLVSCSVIYSTTQRSRICLYCNVCIQIRIHHSGAPSYQRLFRSIQPRRLLLLRSIVDRVCLFFIHFCPKIALFVCRRTRITRILRVRVPRHSGGAVTVHNPSKELPDKLLFLAFLDGRLVRVPKTRIAQVCLRVHLLPIPIPTLRTLQHIPTHCSQHMRGSWHRVRVRSYISKSRARKTTPRSEHLRTRPHTGGSVAREEGQAAAAQRGRGVATRGRAYPTTRRRRR